MTLGPNQALGEIALIIEKHYGADLQSAQAAFYQIADVLEDAGLLATVDAEPSSDELQPVAEKEATT